MRLASKEGLPALLMGREKLKAGRGSGALDISEDNEGERGIEGLDKGV